MITVFIVDDQEVVRKGLKYIFTRETQDIKVIGEYSSCFELLDTPNLPVPDIVITGLMSQEGRGIELCKKYSQKCGVIIFTYQTGHIFVKQAVKAGARGYLMKNAVSSEIIECVYTVNRGNSYMTPVVSGNIVKHFFHQYKDKSSGLSRRELQVLLFIVQGKKRSEIAAELKITPGTVKNHRKNIMKKLSVHTTAELVRIAISEGIAEL